MHPRVARKGLPLATHNGCAGMLLHCEMCMYRKRQLSPMKQQDDRSAAM